MNIFKVKNGNGHIYVHVDRTYKEYHGTSAIDPERSHLNFNCSTNNRHIREQAAFIKSQTGKKPRSNATLDMMVMLTLPKEYFSVARTSDGDIDLDFMHHFFSDAYESLKECFGMREEDVSSAWVHLDEDTPHMHFLATPLWYDEERQQYRLWWNKKMPLQKWRTYHQEVQDNMIARGWTDIRLLNGATKEGNLSVDNLKKATIAKEEALRSEEILRLNQQIDDINKQLNDLAEYMSNENKKLKALQGTSQWLSFAKANEQMIKEALITSDDLSDEFKRKLLEVSEVEK